MHDSFHSESVGLVKPSGQHIFQAKALETSRSDPEESMTGTFVTTSLAQSYKRRCAPRCHETVKTVHRALGVLREGGDELAAVAG